MVTEIPEDMEAQIMNLAKMIGYTDTELAILDLRVQLRQLVEEAREYVPTPSQLATISEIIPRARELFPRVVEARRIPEDWVDIWADYVDIKPLVDDIKRYVSRAERLFARLIIDEDSFLSLLSTVAQFGYTEKEVEFMLNSAKLERYYYVWSELVSAPDRLAYLSEYSPTARELAIGQLSKMIDALPIPEEQKQFIKTMWEEFIRIRPIYDEVRRYVTELLSDYANGVISRETLEKELNDLKKWGLDDYEIEDEGGCLTGYIHVA